MKKEGKNIAKAHAAVEKRPYILQDAVPLLQKVKFAKFDETVEITLRLGVDPKHADQMVRGTVVLPHGLGKSKKVLVIATGEKVKEAEAAGADFAGGDDQNFFRLAQTVRQDDRAAHHLVGMLGIDPQAQRDLDGLVEFCVLHFLQERNGVLQNIGALLDSSVRLGDVLSFFFHCFSLSPTADRYSGQPWCV